MLKTYHLRKHLLAASCALSMAWLVAPAHAMTSNEALVLVEKAASGDAGALAKLREAAQSGDANAQYRLGYMYANGLGIPQNNSKAVFWYHKAATQGEVTAQNALGTFYTAGLGVPQDYAHALYWYSKAAKQNYAAAQYGLGYLYEHGLGVSKNYDRAVHWYRKAAEQGDASAQGELGFMYEHGLGVPQNYVIAYALINLASTSVDLNQFESDAYMAARGDIASHMTKQQIAASQELTRRMQHMGVLEAINSWR